MTGEVLGLDSTWYLVASSQSAPIVSPSFYIYTHIHTSSPSEVFSHWGL